MQKALTTRTQPAQLALLNDVMKQAGKAANKTAARAIFERYQQARPHNTTRRQKADLALFEDFLNAYNVPARDLYTNPQAWRGVSHGLVMGFIEWQLREGYAIDTINVRLSTVKQYSGLAFQAGILDPSEHAQIQIVKGYKHGDKTNIDAKRTAAGYDTRRKTKARLTAGDETPRTNRKKAASIFLTKEQRETITASDGTPQGKRDRLLILLMVDLGLRVGEVAILERKNFDTARGLLVNFYRPKTHKHQTAELTEAALQAARDYLPFAPREGNIWRASAMKNEGKAKRGKLTKRGMTSGAIYKRVELIGRQAGIDGLSPHDLRHTWTERAKHNPAKLVQTAGGWNSPTMVLRYQQAGEISNAGLILADE